METNVEFSPFMVIQGGIADEDTEVMTEAEHPVLYIVAHPALGLIGVFTDKSIMMSSIKDLPPESLLVQEITANTRQDKSKKGI